MVAALIITVWAALAGMVLGTGGVVVAVIVAWVLHGAAVETGNHVSLWLSTAGLLILVVVASAVTLDGLHPVLLAGAGATVLAHNELVRLNYTRRRHARGRSGHLRVVGHRPDPGRRPGRRRGCGGRQPGRPAATGRGCGCRPPPAPCC